jgi:uncharacterized damage-inducible protein DinB
LIFVPIAPKVPGSGAVRKLLAMPLTTSLTTRLEYQHKALLEIIEGLSDEQIRMNITPGKWSVFENMVHLATYQHTFVRRIKQILREENPEFGRYTAESDPMFHDNCSRSSREIMQDLITVRRELISTLAGAKDSELLRKGTHPVFGSMNIPQWMNFFLLHEAHHLFTIFKLVAEIRKKTEKTTSS